MNADHFAVQARVSAGIWGRRPRRAPEDTERDYLTDLETLMREWYLDEGGEA
jgi:hypothetical protein